MKRFLLILGILVVVLTGTVLGLPFLIDVNRFRPMIESELSTSLGREVHLGELSLKPFQGIVSAADLSIADHPGYSRSAFLKAKALTVDIEVWPLLTQRTLNTSGITIVQPEVNLIQSEAGVWNYASLGSHSSDTPKASKNVEKGAAAGMAFLIQSIKLTNGKLTIAHLGSKSRPLVFDKANITITNFSPTSKFPFSLAATFPGGGEIKATGEAGPVPTHDASETPLNLDVHLTHTDLSASGLMAEGSGIDGLASIDADFKSNGKVADLSGKVRVEHLLLAKGGTASTKPVELDYSVQHNLKTQTGRIARGDIHIGTATAKLTGTYDVRNEPGSIKLNLTGPALAISELSPMLPAMGVTLPKGATIENGSALADVAFEIGRAHV